MRAQTPIRRFLERINPNSLTILQGFVEANMKECDAAG